jgi:hypothetical protein
VQSKTPARLDLEGGFAIAERRPGTQQVQKVGRGTAVYLNLSPERYLQATATPVCREQNDLRPQHKPRRRAAPASPSLK